MPTWLQFLLGACALAVTLLQLAGKFGWWAGSSGTSLASLDAEITRLRQWRHKIGEDPSDQVSKMLEIHVRDIERRLDALERKVWNGAPRG